MKTWSAWTRPMALAIAWTFSMAQAMPLAYAHSNLKPAETGGSGVAGEQVRGDTAWVWGPLGTDPIATVGRANLVSIGKEIVSAAFNEGRAFPLVGPGARPIDELVELYAIGYLRRFQKPLTEAARASLTQRLERVKAGIEQALVEARGTSGQSIVRFVPILDEAGSPSLVSPGVGRNPTHFALVAYAGEHAYQGWESAVDVIVQQGLEMGPKSAYLSLEQVEGMLANGDLDALGLKLNHEVKDAIRRHHEDELKEVEDRVNAAIHKVFENFQQKKADEAAAAVKARQTAARNEATVNAKRVQIVPYLMDLGQFFEGNRPPAYVLKAIEARLEQAAREGRITDSRVKPLGHLALLEVHYNGPQRNPKVDNLIVNLVTEVIARESRNRAPASQIVMKVLKNGAVEPSQAVSTAWLGVQALAAGDVRTLREAIRKSRDPYYVLDQAASTALQQAGLLVDGQLSHAARNVILTGAEDVNPFDRQETFQLPAHLPVNDQAAQMTAADQPFETLPYDARVKRLLQGPTGSFAFNHGGAEPIHVSVALGGGPAAFNWPIMTLLDETLGNQLKIEGIRVNELNALRAADQKKDEATLRSILELEQELKEIQQLKAEQAQVQSDLDRLQALQGKGEELAQALAAMRDDLAKQTETEGPGYVVVIERISDILEGKRERTSYRFVYPRSAPYIHTLVDDQTEWVITSVLPRPGSRRYNVNKSPDNQDPMCVVMVGENPVAVFLEQSGFPAMGEFTAATSQFYLTTTGHGVGTRHVGVIPVTAEEADSGAFADRGLVRLVSDAYMSKGTSRPQDRPGEIPHYEVHDQVGLTSDIRATREQNLWVHDELSMMGTFQPAVTAPEAERRSEAALHALGDRYHEIPAVVLRGPDGRPRVGPDGKPLVRVDSILEASNQKAAVTVSDLKADIGATGHQSPYALQYAAFRASFNVAKRHGLIDGFELEKAGEGLLNNYDLGNAGDDSHFVLFHKRGVDDPEIHALAFATFFRAGWLIHQFGYQLYGDMQDFVQAEVQQLIRERKLHVYAKLDDEFMAELKNELDHMSEAGRWSEIQEGYERVQGISVTLPAAQTLTQVVQDAGLISSAAIQSSGGARRLRSDVQVFLQDRDAAGQLVERPLTNERGEWLSEHIGTSLQPGQTIVIRQSGRVTDFRLPGNVTGMGIGFAEKAFSKEEIERFGHVGIIGNDKAASGAFNFGIYWALRLSVLLKQVHVDHTIPNTAQDILAALESEVAQKDPQLPLDLRAAKAQRLFEAVQELHDVEGYAQWIDNGLVVEPWHVAPGSRAFVDVESEDEQLLALLSAQNEHNVKRIWLKKRNGWIDDLTAAEVAAIEQRVDQELRDNRTQFEDRKAQLIEEVRLYEATRNARTRQGRALGTLNPWERMLYDQEIDSVITAVRPKFIEVYKVREFIGDDYLASVSTEKLAAITQGNYVGKDDSVMVSIEPFAALYRGIAKGFVRFNVGNARGSQWPAMRPEASPVAGGISKSAVAVQWSNSIEIAYRYRFNPDGTVAADPNTGLARREDMYSAAAGFDPIRQKVSDLNLTWIQTQGGFTPHGPNVYRDVEGAYPARQTLDSLTRPGSQFAYAVDDPTLTTVGQGRWGQQVLDVTDYALAPDVAGQAADPGEHRWIILHSSVFTRPDSAIVQAQIRAQINSALGGGASSLHFALAVEGASTAEEEGQSKAERGVQALGLDRDDFTLVFPAEGNVDQMLGVVEGAIRGSRIGGVVGPREFVQTVKSNSPHPEQVGVFVLEPEAAIAGPLIIGAVEAAATKNTKPPTIAAKLRELEEGVFASALAIGDIEASVQTEVRAYQEQKTAQLAAAIKG